MTLAFWYWGFLILSLFWGGFREYRNNSNTINGPFFIGFGVNIILFILLVIIGIQLSGSPADALVKGK